MTRTASARRRALLALLGLAGSVLAGCGGSSGQSAAPAGSPSGSASPSGSTSSSGPASSAPPSSSVVGPSAPAFASTSAGTPKGMLSMPDFLIEMNAVCSAIDAQRQALPTPTSLTDFDTINLNLTGTMRLVPVLIAKAQRLVAQTAQRAELEKNWLALERADYAVIKPIAERMAAHSRARDAAAVEAAAADMATAPNHSSSMKTYLDGYGLYSCAHLHAD